MPLVWSNEAKCISLPGASGVGPVVTHHHPGAGRCQLFELINISQGAEFGDVFEVAPRQAQLARPRARGDHQLVPAKHPATGQRNLFRGEVDRGRRLARDQVDAVLGVIVQRLEEQPLGVHLTLEIGLGKGGTLIRRRGFIANNRDFARKTALPQRIRCLPARLACANDDNALRRIRHAGCPSRNAGVLA